MPGKVCVFKKLFYVLFHNKSISCTPLGMLSNEDHNNLIHKIKPEMNLEFSLYSSMPLIMNNEFEQMF